MTQFPHDPNSLADELDRLLPPGQTGQSATSNDPLVEAAARLSAAPRPTLSPEAMARIHATMLSGQNAAPAGSRSLRFLRQSAPVRLAVAAILLFAFVTGAIFAAKIGVLLLNSPTAVTTALPPSATLLPTTSTPLPSSPTPNAIDTDTSTPQLPAPTVLVIVPERSSATPIPIPKSAVPGATFTLVPTLTPTTAIEAAISTKVVPTPTPKLTLPVTVIVEGPIQSINGNTIVIFDLTILLNDTDLAKVQVGDIVRVEGNYAEDSQIIIAIRVTVLRNTPVPTSNVEVNSSTGQTWTDPGNCSNPPPPWAPANGWRRRCQGASNSGNSGNSSNPGNSGGNGNGMGNGMGG